MSSTLKHLLVHLDGGARSAVRIDLSLALAARFGARLAGLFAESAWLGPSLVSRRDPARVAALARQVRASFEAKCAAAGVVTDWWQLDLGEYAHLVGWAAVCCRYVDLAVFGQHEEEDGRVPEDLIEQALRDSGRPLLVVPSAGHFSHVGRRVVVAWTGSRESARALNDALPLMADAQEVTVLALQQPELATAASVPALSIVQHLETHGIAAKYEKMIVGDEVAVVDLVLNRAADAGADLCVVGGYGQLGFPFLNRSSTTRAILRTMTTPVLLSH